jgi:hypothetical protein
MDNVNAVAEILNTRRTRRDLEHRLQCSCVRWFNLQHPQLRGRLFAVPNGGSRSKSEAARLKAEGVVAGVADLILLKPNRHSHALLIEMKTGDSGSRQSARQREWQDCVTSGGEYQYTVCRSLEDFMRTVNEYLGYG